MESRTMEKYIEQFCKTPTSKGYSVLPDFVQDFLVDVSFQSLSQKTGSLEKSQKILEISKQIRNIHGYNVYIGPKLYQYKESPKIQQLSREGVVTFSILHKKEIPHYQKLFDRTLQEFPEYKNPTPETLFVLGGFAALGNPSSFHNTFVRNLRIKCWDKVMPFFQEYVKGYIEPNLRLNYRLEVLWDRMMKRNKGKAPGAEAWHRDVISQKLIQPEDEIYGGWINLDSQDQYFSCIPGSQLGVSLYNIPSGFDTLEKRLQNIFQKDDKDPLSVKKKVKKVFVQITKEKKIYRIPPGHMIMFPQYILHEVVAQKSSYDMKRLFLGWRLTTSKNSIYLNKKEIMKNQAVVPLPSGQIPPMYSPNHQSCYLGIPVIKKVGEKFNLNKWALQMANKFKILYPTERMKKLAKKISSTKKTKRSIIAKMTSEYLLQPNIHISFDQKKFIQDSDLTLNIGTMKTDPSKPSSLTTLIKWSEDTFDKKILDKKNYKNQKNQYYFVIPRHMPSLKKLNLPLYPPYVKEEKKIYKPYRLTKRLKIA